MALASGLLAKARNQVSQQYRLCLGWPWVSSAPGRPLGFLSHGLDLLIADIAAAHRKQGAPFPIQGDECGQAADGMSLPHGLAFRRIGQHQGNGDGGGLLLRQPEHRRLDVAALGAPGGVEHDDVYTGAPPLGRGGRQGAGRFGTA